MQRGNNKKFCPRCGTPNEIRDAYCIRCGFAFKARARKSGLNPIITIIILLIIAWVFYRTVTKQDLIPSELTSFFKNLTLPKLK
jgi:uncharacterized paraquat-inducible protein A